MRPTAHEGDEKLPRLLRRRALHRLHGAVRGQRRRLRHARNGRRAAAPIADPSHGTGRSDCVELLARASVAVAADGVMLEVHPHPDAALSDGPQALLPSQLAPLMRELDIIASAIGRRVASGPSRAIR